MIKTVTLEGAELCVTGLGGQNAVVKNLGAKPVWASNFADISPGTDNVCEIPAGGGEVLLNADGTVYLFGTGTVQVTETNYSTVNFKMPSAGNSAGGGNSYSDSAYICETVNDDVVDKAIKQKKCSNADEFWEFIKENLKSPFQVIDDTNHTVGIIKDDKEIRIVAPTKANAKIQICIVQNGQTLHTIDTGVSARYDSGNGIVICQNNSLAIATSHYMSHRAAIAYVNGNFIGFCGGMSITESGTEIVPDTEYVNNTLAVYETFHSSHSGLVSNYYHAVYMQSGYHVGADEQNIFFPVCDQSSNPARVVALKVTRLGMGE